MNIERANRIRSKLGLPLFDLQVSVDPNLSQKISNATGALKRVVRAASGGDKVFVTEDECERRLGICQSCEFFTGKTCRKCGCVVVFKTRLNTEHCPIRKW